MLEIAEGDSNVKWPLSWFEPRPLNWEGVRYWIAKKPHFRKEFGERKVGESFILFPPDKQRKREYE